MRESIENGKRRNFSGASAASLVSPERVSGMLPSRPILKSWGAWPDLELQMYRHPPGQARTPGPRDHVLVLNLSGRILIDDFVDGRRRRAWADAGCFSLIPAGQMVRRSWKGSPEILLIYLNPALLRTVAEDLDLDPSRLELVPRLAVPDPMLHHFGCLLRDEAAHRCTGSEIVIDALTRALAVHLLRHHSNRTTRTPAPSPMPTMRRMNEVIDFMRMHVDEPVSLPRLAKICGLSTPHFTRAFRETIGQPPHAFLIGLRLERARDLLEHTALSITEIAFSSGFEQSQYFATLFRRKLGCTPSEWRRHRSRN